MTKSSKYLSLGSDKNVRVDDEGEASIHSPVAQTSGSGKPTQFHIVTRSLLAWLIMCAGIGIAVTLAQLISSWIDLGVWGVALTQSLLVFVLVVPPVLWLRNRVDRRSCRGMGLSNKWLQPLGIGIGVGVGAVTACLVWIPAFLIGWIELERVDLPALFLFLVMNTIVLFLYEAFPEELVLRGYVWSSLRERWRPVLATLFVTCLFPLSAFVISVVQTGSALVFGAATNGIMLAPAGNDPIAYFVQLFLFGLVLCAARRIPISGALIICVSFHIVQLTVNRLLLGGTGWLDAGITINFVDPDAIILVLAHIGLSGVVFWVIRKRYERKRSADRVAEA